MAEAKTYSDGLNSKFSCCGSRSQEAPDCGPTKCSPKLWWLGSRTQVEHRLYVPMRQGLNTMMTLLCTVQVIYVIFVQGTPLKKNYWGEKIAQYKDPMQIFCILSPYITSTHTWLHLTLLPWMPFRPGSPGGPLTPYTKVKVENEFPLKMYVRFLLNLAWTGYSTM